MKLSTEHRKTRNKDKEKDKGKTRRDLDTSPQAQLWGSLSKQPLLSFCVAKICMRQHLMDYDLDKLRVTEGGRETHPYVIS